ncbi:MAG: oligoribonuclease [Alcanivoracaceae bacterium]|nr:oligoribonuclease [Alcanivoracaceae bacterium]
MASKRDNLIWIDLEMTGLDTDNDKIIEIATLVTDKELNVLAEGPVLAIHQDDKVLAAMDEWNTTTHTGSGLVDRVRQSRWTEQAAEAETLAFLEQYVERGMSPMCGNSICQDRRFLHRSMPRLENFFHYRNLDVSTIKELARRWKPEVLEHLTKSGRHVAMDDIRDSITELKFYRKHVFSI